MAHHENLLCAHAVLGSLCCLCGVSFKAQMRGVASVVFVQSVFLVKV